MRFYAVKIAALKLFSFATAIHYGLLLIQQLGSHSPGGATAFLPLFVVFSRFSHLLKMSPPKTPTL